MSHFTRFVSSPFTVLCVLVFLAILVIFFQRIPVQSAPAEKNTAFMRVEIEKKIKQSGSKTAYENLKLEYQGTSLNTRHTAAHIFGESLFVIEGMNGVSICDASFNYGCFHGFFSRAVATNGIESIAEMNRACGIYAKRTGCQHGIGHGILEYLGPARLNEALSACKDTQQVDPTNGCTVGVFMEYNMPVSTSADGEFMLTPRLLDSRGLYSPCTELEGDAFLQGCYFSLPQWWGNAYSSDFTVLGKLCEAIPDPLSRRFCFLGIGNIAGNSTNWSVPGIQSECGKMPDRESESVCLLTAAWALRGNTEDISHARALCAGALPADQERCSNI